MRIAVTYDNGNVFPHFGRTEQFKLYTVQNGAVVAEEVISSNGVGHEALAGLLAQLDVQALICGGMGDGAKAALDAAGIVVCSGAEGSTDEAVAAYLRGELVSAGINCDHHHHEHEQADEVEATEGCGGCGGCGGESSEGGSCGSGCGGCGGCGSHRRVTLEGKNAGKRCRVHYRGTLNDGTQFDSSYDRGEPLEFTCGIGMMIPGFDKAVLEMEVGEEKDIHLMPAEAYGEKDPSQILVIKIAELPGSEQLNVGDQAQLYNQYGMPIGVTVTAKDDVSITLDANHALAGKELNFHVELVEVL